jgi:tetratricopeptide (TPR) repeat protein
MNIPFIAIVHKVSFHVAFALLASALIWGGPAFADESHPSSYIRLVSSVTGSIDELTEEVRQHPTDPRVRVKRALAFVRDGYLEKALWDLNGAVLLDETCIEAVRLRRFVWSLNGQFAEALADCNAALLRDPTDASKLVDRGFLFADNREFDRAISDFSEAIRLDASLFAAYRGRGMAFYYLQQYDKALADINHALHLYSADAGSYYARGSILREQGNVETAIQDFDKAIGLDPKDSDFLVGRGQCWYFKDDFEKALADYNHAIRIWPRNAEAFLNRGILAEDTMKFDWAVKDYNQAIRLEQTNVEALSCLASLRATCVDATFRDGKQAVELAKKACDLTKWKSDSELVTLATAYAELGDFPKAKDALGRAIELSTTKKPTSFQQKLKVLFEADTSYRREVSR